MLNKMFFVMIASVCLTTTGCQFINPITPIIQLGIFWLEGEAHKYYNTPQDEIEVAVKSALKELEFSIVEEGPEEDYYWIKATDNSRVVQLESGELVASTFKIKVREVKHNITKLSIRVNTFGDRPYAEMIYRHVDDYDNVIQFTTVRELNKAYKTRSRPRR